MDWKRLLRYCQPLIPNSSTRRDIEDLFPELSLMRLEERRVLSVSPLAWSDHAGQLTVALGPAAPQDSANTLRIVRQGGSVAVALNGNTACTASLADLSSIVVNDGNQHDTLVVDYSGGNPLPVDGLQFHGATSAGNDQLVLDQGCFGGSIAGVAFQFVDLGQGSIQITFGGGDANAQPSTIAYSGVNSVQDNLHPDRLSFQSLVPSQNLTIAADGDDQSLLSTGDGASVAFAAPAVSLAVSTDLLNTASHDTLTIAGFDSGTATNVTINAGAADTVDFTGITNLHGGNLTATGGAINAGGSIVSPGGSINLDAGSQGTLQVSGTIDVSNLAAGQTGGTVYLQGERVGLLDNALIDASGDAGGGTVLVGGGFHGSNPSVLDAQQTYVSPTATISADAVTSGNGGQVAVWSNEATQFYGQINARGGAASGHGGFVETSSAEDLAFEGHVDTTAPGGSPGTLLLDPENITVQTGGGATYAQVDAFATLPTGTETVDPTTLNAVGGNVVLQANNNITISNAIDLTTSGATLTMQAGLSILVNANLTTTNAAISLIANDTVADGVVNVDRLTGNAVITMGTGTTISAGSGGISLLVSTGPTTYYASGSITLANLTTSGTDSVNDNGPTALSGVSVLTGAVVSGSSVTLRSGGTGAAAISETGTGAVSTTGLLTTTSATGQTLGGSNTVGSFNATNSTSGNISLTNTASTLTVTGISETGGGITVGNTGSLAPYGAVVDNTAGYAISLTATTGVLSVAAAVTGTTTDTISLTSTGEINVVPTVTVSTGSGGITLSSGADIIVTGSLSTTGLLTTTAASGVNLTGANAVGSFNATNSTSGGVSLNDTASTLTVTGISDPGGGNVGVNNTGALMLGGAIVAAAGEVGITASGAVAIDSNVTAASFAAHSGVVGGAGNTTFGAGVTVQATTQSYRAGNGSGTTDTANLITTSPTFENTAGTSAPTTFTYRQDAAIADANILPVSQFLGGAVPSAYSIQSDGGALTISTAGKVAGSVLTLSAGTTLTIGAALNLASLSATAVTGSITESSGSVTTSGLMTTSSATGQTLGGSNAVGSFIATNSTSGNISLTNTVSTLTVTGISQTGGGNVAVTNTGALTTSGAISTAANGSISLTATNGTETISAAVTAGGSGGVTLGASGATSSLLVQAAVSSTSGAIGATAGAAITESGGGKFGTTGLLTASSVTGETLGGANTVGSFNATNGTSGNISLTNTVSTLTVTGISQSGGGSVTVSNTGALTTSGAITTAANGSISLIATNGTETTGAAVTAGGSGGVTLGASGATSSLLVQAAVISTSGAIGATAGAAITESGSGKFGTTGLLTTSSVMGETLGGSNTVGSFNATNSTSGAISLTNTAATLTVTGISQTGGGNVSVTNSGAIAIQGLNCGGSAVTVQGSTVAFDVDCIVYASSLTVQAESNSANSITVAVDAEINADTQAYQATGGSLASANLGNVDTFFQAAAGILAPANFTFEQGASVTDAILPQMWEYEAPVSYTIKSDDGNITVTNNNEINYGGMTFSAPNGTVTIGAGGQMNTTSLHVSAQSVSLDGQIWAWERGTQTYTCPVILTGNTEVAIGDGPGTITFDSTINADSAANQRTLTVFDMGGENNFYDQIGGSQALQSFSVDTYIDTGSGSTVLGNAATDATMKVVTDGGGQQYGNSGEYKPVTLGANTTLIDTGSGAITLYSSVDADAAANDRTLTIQTGGTLTFSGQVGASQALQSLAASGGTIAINQTMSLAGGFSATATGSITESGSGAVSTSGLMTTNSGTGQTLSGAGTNAVGSFNATNTTSGNISLTNNIPLTVTGISQSGGGNIYLATAGALTTNGAITTAANGSISLTATNGTETIGAAVTAGGSGTVTLTATGATDNLNVNAAVSSTSGAISATAGAAITQSGSGAFATTGGLTTNTSSANGNQSLTASGTVGITSFNAGTGTITLNSGKFSLIAANGINASSSLNVNGGTLAIAGFSDTVAGVTLTTGSITGSGGTLTSTSTFAAQSGTVSAILGGSVGLTMSGSGTLTLDGADTYTGLTTINSGTVVVGSATALGPAAHAAVAFGASSGTLSLNGNSISLTGLTTTNATPIVQNANAAAATLTITNTAANTYAGLLQDGTGGGALALVVNGTNTLTLSGANTYGGGTTVTGGTLQAGNQNAFGQSGSQITIQSGATLDLNGNGNNSYNFSVSGGGVGGNGAIVNNGASAASISYVSLTGDTVFGGTASWSISSINNQETPTQYFQGNGFSLTKVGANEVDFSTGGFSNFTVVGVKNYYINSGTLGLLQEIDSYLTVDNSQPGSIYVNSGGVLRLSVYISSSIGGNSILKPVVMSGGTITADSWDVGISPTINAGISLNSTGTFSPQAGTTIVLDGAVSDGSGSNGINMVGAGELVLGANNTYSGGTTLTAGTLLVGSGGASGTLGSGAVSDSGSLVVDLGSVYNLSNTISGTGSLTQAGTGTTTVSGTNSYTGGTTVSGGTLALGGTGALGNTTNYTSSVTVNSGAALDLGGYTPTAHSVPLNVNGQVSGSVGALTNSGGAATYGGAVTLQSAASIGGSGNITLSGNISGAYGLTKVGNDTLTVSGANIYTGSTTITAGALVLGSTGALGSTTSYTSSVSVSNGAALDLGGYTPNANNNNVPLYLNGQGILSAGALINSGAAATYGGTVTLNDNAGIGGPGNIALAGTISSSNGNNYNLTLSNSGAVTLDGAVSGLNGFNATGGVGSTLTVNNTISAVSLSDGEATTLSGGSVTTTAGQSYAAAVTLGANTTLTDTGSGNIDFAYTVDGSYTLAVNTGGVTSFDGAVGGGTALTSVTTDAGGSTDINGRLVKTTAAQTYNDAVLLTADATATSTGGGNITFGSTVDGAYALAVQTGGAVAFDGIVGGSSPPAKLTVAGYTISVDASVTTSGNQSYTDAGAPSHETVTADGIALTTTAPSTTVTFNGQLSPGDGTFDSDAVVALLTVNSSLVFGNSATLYVTLNGANHATGIESTDASSPPPGYYDQVSVSGTVTIGNSALVQNEPNGTSDNFSFDGGKTAFIIQATGTVSAPNGLNGSITIAGQPFTVSGVGANALVLTRQAQTWSWTGLAGNSYWSDPDNWYGNTGHPSGGDSVTFGAYTTADFSPSNDLTNNDGTPLTLGSITFNNTAGGGFTLSGDRVTLEGGINDGSASGITETIAMPITLGANQTIGTTSGQLVLGGAITGGGSNLTLANSRLVQLNGAVSGVGTLTADGTGTLTVNNTISAGSLSDDEATTLNGTGGIVTITTTAGQSYAAAVTLGANTTLTDTGAANIAFVSTVDGSYMLAVNTSGVTTFGGAVGGGTALTSVTTDAGGSTDINGRLVTTTAAQTYNDAVLLTADAVLASTAGGNVTLNDTVDGTYALMVNTTGNEVFNGLVGNAATLASVTTDASGAVGGSAIFQMDASTAATGKGGVNAGTVTIHDGVTFNATGSSTSHPSVETTGAQTYISAVTLGQDTVLADTANGNITFESAVGASAAGVQGLTVSTGGEVIFKETVGGSGAALASLTASGNLLTLEGNVTASGNISLVSNATITIGVLLTTTGGGNLILVSTSGSVDVNAPLSAGGAATITASDAIVLNNAAGTPLTTAAGNISLTAGTGGIGVINTNPNRATADIASTGATVTLNTSGPVGGSGNAVEFADNPNTAQQNVVIGSTDQPSGVYLDGLGSLTLGSIITAAGASLTGLNQPVALAFDGSGNLYVASLGDNAVSEFAPGSTTPTATLTGLNQPVALAFDGSGNLYVTNLGNNTVSEFAPGSTTPTATLTGLNDPEAMAFDGSGNLYVANGGNGSGTTVSEFAPGSTTPTATLTGLSTPYALAFDGSGNLYVANYNSNTVSEFAPGGTTPIATLSGLNGPYDLAFDGGGNLYVANEGNGSGTTVSEFAPGSVAPSATLTGLSQPLALAFDGSGDLYVANDGSGTVSKFAPGSTAPTATITGLSGPNALAFDGSGNLYAANYGSGTVSKFAPGHTGFGGTIDVTARTNLAVADGATINSGTSTLSLGADLNADGTGNDGTGTLSIGAGAVVASSNAAANAITLQGAHIEIDTSADPATVGGQNALSTTPSATLTGVHGPAALAFDNSGNLYVANYISSTTVSVFAPGSATPTATLTGLNNPTALAFDGSGDLYVANAGAGSGATVSEFAPGATTPIATLTGLNWPYALAFDSSGNLYVANYGGGSGTTVSEFAPRSTTPTATLTGLSGPAALAFDSSGNLYVANYGNGSATTVSEFAPGATTPTATLNGLDGPGALAFDQSGNLYVANEGGTTVSVFAPGSTTPTATLTGLNEPYALAFDRSGNLYVTNASNNTVSEFAPGSTTPTATLTGLNVPVALAFDGSGNLYVANYNNDTVSKFASGGTAGGVVIRTSLSSLPMSLGGTDNAVAGINLTAAELVRIQTTATGTVTVGDSAQTGDITFTNATLATTAGASTVVLQDPDGTGRIVLDDGAGAGTALDGNGGTVSLTAGTGGIVALNADDTAAEIATTGTTVTLNTPGPIGSIGNPIHFANNANTAEQNVVIGSTIQPGGVFLDGLGSLTLGSIQASANAPIDIAAAGDLRVATGVTLTGLSGPYALAFDGSGNLYVANHDNGTVSEYAPGSTTPTATLTGLTYPDALAFDSSGDLFVTNYLGGTNDTVSEFAPGSITATATLTGLSDPIALAFDGSGNLYVANAGNNRSGTTVSEFAPGSTTPTAVLTGLNDPIALAVDGSGNLYVANAGNGSGTTVSEFAPGSTTPTATLTGLSTPYALAFDGSGNLYVANYGNNTVSQFAPGSTTPTATLTGLSGPYALAFDSSGNLYVANHNGNSVSVFTPGSTSPSATFVGMSTPDDLALDGSGHLYVANAGDNTVSVVTPGRAISGGAVTLTATDGSVSIGTGVVLQSSTGTVFTAPPIVSVKDQGVASPVTPKDTEQTLTGTIGLPGEVGENFALEVCWFDGQVSVITGLDSGNSYTIVVDPVNAHIISDIKTDTSKTDDLVHFTVQRTYQATELEKDAGALARETGSTLPATVFAGNDGAYYSLPTNPSGDFGAGPTPTSVVPGNILLYDAQSGSAPSNLLDLEHLNISQALSKADLGRGFGGQRPQQSSAIAPASATETVAVAAATNSVTAVTTKFEEIQAPVETASEDVRVFYLVPVGSDGTEGAPAALAPDAVSDLAGLFNLFRKQGLPNGTYRVYMTEPGFPPRKLIEFHKSGNSFGDPVHEPGRGSNPISGADHAATIPSQRDGLNAGVARQNGDRPGTGHAAAVVAPAVRPTSSGAAGRPAQQGRTTSLDLPGLGGNRSGDKKSQLPGRLLHPLVGAATLVLGGLPSYSRKERWDQLADKAMEESEAGSFGLAARLRRRLRKAR